MDLNAVTRIVTVALAVLDIVWHQQLIADKLRDRLHNVEQRLARIEGFLGIGTPAAAASEARARVPLASARWRSSAMVAALLRRSPEWSAAAQQPPEEASFRCSWAACGRWWSGDGVDPPLFIFWWRLWSFASQALDFVLEGFRVVVVGGDRCPFAHLGQRHTSRSGVFLQDVL